jgi:hypothetical protein
LYTWTNAEASGKTGYSGRNIRRESTINTPQPVVYQVLEVIKTSLEVTFLLTSLPGRKLMQSHQEEETFLRSAL